MSYLENYLERLSETSKEAAKSVEKTTDELVPAHIESFNFKEHITGLLLGQVQSGKTSQMFGIIAAAADVGFDLFIVLTADNNALQQQTYERALNHMDGFNVCGKDDELRFEAKGMREPTIIVSKKNTTELRDWRNTLASTGYCRGRPLFMVDDEADAASLNTKVNQEDQSTINNHLESMKEMFTSSFYLQVTATPQALLLQKNDSQWRPSFVHYFAPGEDHLGGKFFYSKPKPYTVKYTSENELSQLLDTDKVADGLKRAIETYLVTASHVMGQNEKEVCNFLVHPSIRIEAQTVIASKIEEYLAFILNNLDTDDVQKRLKKAWDDLKSSRPDIMYFDAVVDFLDQEGDEVAVYAMNSGPEGDTSIPHNRGMNIIVGGISLGRGVTFQGLQTVYYCRRSQTPQADTYWQHSRMFGYDRDPLLMRLFIPYSLFNMFAEINNSNQVLIELIKGEGSLDDLQLMYPPGVKATRGTVVDKDLLSSIVGGANYFPFDPDQSNLDDVDEILEDYDEVKPVYDIDLNELIEILQSLDADKYKEWSLPSFINAIESLKAEEGRPNLAKLIVRRDRDVGRGTGTLLSPDDRKLGSQFVNIPVLTMYRVEGSKDKGWSGEPFWVPNIKLPKGKVFIKTE